MQIFHPLKIKIWGHEPGNAGGFPKLKPLLANSRQGNGDFSPIPMEPNSTTNQNKPGNGFSPGASRGNAYTLIFALSDLKQRNLLSPIRF